MKAILELPEARNRVSPISVEEYHRLNEFNENGRRTELVRGIVFEKMFKSPLHAAFAKELYDYFASNVPAGFLVRQESPLTLRDSEPEPDLAVVRGAKESFFLEHPTTAELVIEVAVASPALDRENASIYAEAGIKEYWIVILPRCVVEVHTLPTEGRYLHRATFAGAEELTCSAIPNIKVRLSSLLPAR